MVLNHLQLRAVQAELLQLQRLTEHQQLELAAEAVAEEKTLPIVLLEVRQQAAVELALQQEMQARLEQQTPVAVVVVLVEILEKQVVPVVQEL